jgi:tRNA threonylcarbamoyladenosine biosynthesis protein TsaE
MPVWREVARGEEETRRVAACLARRLRPGSVVALHGELGAGKTCFVRGMAAALGCDVPVASPTFTLLHEYGGSPPLYHADLYRLTSLEEFMRAGLMDYFERDGVLAIEWAEKVAALLPPQTIHVHLRLGADADEREIEIEEPDT